MNTEALESNYRKIVLDGATQATQRRVKELRHKGDLEISYIHVSIQLQCDKAAEQLACQEEDLRRAVKLLREDNPEVLALFERSCFPDLGIASDTRDLAFHRLVAVLATFRYAIGNSPRLEWAVKNFEKISPFDFGEPGGMLRLEELGWVKHVYINQHYGYQRVTDSPPKDSKYRDWYVLTDRGKSVYEDLVRQEEGVQGS